MCQTHSPTDHYTHASASDWPAADVKIFPPTGDAACRQITLDPCLHGYKLQPNEIAYVQAKQERFGMFNQEDFM